jgi:hypothetical protein
LQPTGLFDISQTVLDCVCAQMDLLAETVDDYPGCPSCLVHVSAGEPAIDCCDGTCEGGMLTVHVEDTFPSDAFPRRSEGFEPCKAQTWVALVVVTVARCAPSESENGDPPSPEVLTANAWLLAVDSYAALTALGCCLVDDPPPGKRKRRVLIAGATPVTTSGGCAAVEVRASVEVGQVCACSPASS